VFSRLLEELNEFLGETPEPDGKKPVQMHRDLMPTHERILRGAYLQAG